MSKPGITSDDILSTGQGICRVETMLVIRIDAASLEMGLGNLLFRTIFNAVHRVNRRGRQDGFVAIQLPDFGIHVGAKGMDLAGDRVCLFGSQAALERVTQDRELMKFANRQCLEFTFSPVPQGSAGRALLRTRACEKATSGRARRDAARRVRRASHIEATRGSHASNRKVRARPDVHLQLNSGVVLDILVQDGQVDSREVTVSTFGLSTSAKPQFLPLAAEG